MIKQLARLPNLFLMRLLLFNLIFTIIFIFFSNHNYLCPHCPSPTMSQIQSPRLFIHLGYTFDCNIVIEFIFEILAFSAITCLTLFRALKHILNSVRYQHFSSATVRKSKMHVSMDLEYADMFLFSLFVFEFDPIVLYLLFMDDIKIQYLIYYHPDGATCSTIFMFILQYTSRLSLLLSLWQALPSWLIFIRLILANDVELNPGEFSNSFFTFCNWNVNSLAKNNFERVQLLEAHNALFNYDLISLCEVSLNSTVEIPVTLLENYTFISKNNPNDNKHGGVGLFYKNNLPLLVRNDLSFNETLVSELKFGNKRIFFTVIYRSPSQNYGSTGFDEFLINFENLFKKIKNENPYSVFFTGDFNGHSQLW